ncbi:MAG: SOS response-associated peptidase [Patescibacteria group bacterium]
MCGRFSLGTTDLRAEYNLATEVKIKPRYNIAPGTEVPVIISENGRNVFKMMRWGFELRFGDQPPKLIINAMGETLAEKATFKKLVQSQRCLIPATGFYEWKKTEAGKIPHYFFLKDQKMFSLGGLYRLEKNETGEEVLTCVVITTQPNELMQPVHNRMPLIISKLNENAWLNSANSEAVQSLIKPFAAEDMKAVTVSKKVNNAGNDSPDLIEEFRWEVGR